MKFKAFCLTMMIVFFSATLISTPSVAQIPIPPKQGVPDKDPTTTMGKIAKTIASGISKVVSLANQVSAAANAAMTGVKELKQKVSDAVESVKKGIESAVKAAKDWVKGVIDSMKKKKDEPNISVARKIEPSKVIDITNEKEVAEMYEKLFLIYPQDIIKEYPENKQNEIRSRYRRKATIFADDALVEMYLTVRFLEAWMNELKKELDQLSACYVYGDTESTKDSSYCADASGNATEIDVWKNYYKVNVIYDSLLRVVEELYAIRAQYEVSQGLKTFIRPYVEEDDSKTSSNSEKKASLEPIFFEYSVPSAFAQVNMMNVEAVNDNQKVDLKSKLQNAVQATQNQIQSQTNAVQGPKSSFAETMARLKNAINAGEKVKEVKEMKVFNTAEEIKPESTVQNTLQAQGAQRAVVSKVQDLKVIHNNQGIELEDNLKNTLAAKSSQKPVVSAEKSLADKIVDLKNSIKESLKAKEVEATQVSAQKKKNTGITTLAPYEIHMPYVPSDEYYEGLQQITDIQTRLMTGVRFHNLKKQIPVYRRSFVSLRGMKRVHDVVLDRLRESERCAVNYLSQYYDQPEKVWFGSSCRMTSDGKIFCTSNRDVNAQTLKNINANDILCPDNNSKLCSRFGVNSYSDRSGLSGWLVSAFKTAKAEKAVELSMDDMSPAMMEDTEGVSIAEMKKSMDRNKAQKIIGADDDLMTKPSQMKEIEKSVRQTDILAWQIGAEGAKAIGKDMLSDNPKWGVAKSHYTLWKDEKIFYDQYLRKKYHNMAVFVESLDLNPVIGQAALEIANSLSGALNGLIPIAPIKTKAVGVINKVIGLYDENPLTPDQTAVQKVKLGNDQKLKQFSASYGRKLQLAQSESDNVYAKLDTEGVALKESKLSYNEQVGEGRHAKGMIEASKSALASVALKRAKGHINDEPTGVELNSQNDISSGNKVAEAATKMKAALQKTIDSGRARMDNLKDNLDTVSKNLANVRSEYLVAAAKVENETLEAVRLAQASGGGVAPLSQTDYFQKALTESRADGTEKSVIDGILSLAEEYASSVKGKIVERIEKAHDQIKELGDDVYKPENHAKIVKIHQDMIRDIENLATVDTISSSLPVGNVAATLTNLFKTNIYQEICGDGQCLTTDDRYFVGLPPKTEDFKAPKAIVQAYSAPMREVVHFDLADFENVAKSADSQMTTREEFLKYGQDVPEVWKAVLSPNGFVESDVDIKDFLSNNDNASDVLLRGGAYPCTVGNYDVDFKDGSFYLYPKKGAKSVCKGIQSASVYLNAMARLIMSDGERVTARFGKEQNNYEPSELSLLLKYQNGLTFSDKVKDIVAWFEELDTSDPDEYGIKGKLYEKAMLSRNQFGAYLKYVDIEMMHQKAIEELEVNIDEMRNNIREALSERGIEIDPKFDLADDATFNDIMNKLDKEKNKILNQAVTDFSALKLNSENLIERGNNVKNLIKQMQMDSDEVVAISGASQADASFTQKIKAAITDNEALKRFAEEANDSAEDTIKSLEEPFCAVY